MRRVDFTCVSFTDVRRIAGALYPAAANYRLMGDNEFNRASLLRIEKIAIALRSAIVRGLELISDPVDCRGSIDAHLRKVNASLVAALGAGASYDSRLGGAVGRWLLSEGVVPVTSVRASVEHPAPWTAHACMLSSGTAWHVHPLTPFAWIQLDAGVRRLFLAIRLLGRGDGHPQWVTKFKLEFSDDGEAWYSAATYDGNTSAQVLVEHRFPAGILARFVRLTVLEYSTHPNVRWDLLALDTE